MPGRESKSEKADTRFGQRQSPINALPLKQAKTDAKEWQVLSLAVDSGAAESVIPHLLITEHPIRETEAYLRGLNNISATGDLLPNLGEQRPPLITRDGNTMSMTLQAAQVDRPLGSVKRKCHVGHRVVFDSDGSYVLNTATKEINWFARGKTETTCWTCGSYLHHGCNKGRATGRRFYEASPTNRNGRVSPTNSDGVDPEGRREAGQADDDDKCRVVRSRDLAVRLRGANPLM